MIYAKGTRVRLRNTGDEGVITELLGNGLVAVYLKETDMEIPTYEDNLEPAEGQLVNKTVVKAKIVPGKQPRPAEPISFPPSETQYKRLKSKGLLLAFDRSNDQSSFGIHLINDTKFDLIFTFALHLNNVLQQKSNNKLAANQVFEVGNLSYNQLNDTPLVKIECWQITTEGTGSRLSKELKIKPKQFFKKETTAPFLNRKAHLYTVFQKLDAAPKAAKKDNSEDLRLYTKRNIRPPKTRHLRQYNQFDLHEYAAFEPEIDLHIEKLSDNYEAMSNAEIVQLQMRHFEQFIDKALRLGIDRVFVIHGLGKGRLKDMIASRLLQHPHVTTFKNEYHPRYGWGATEVIF